MVFRIGDLVSTRDDRGAFSDGMRVKPAQVVIIKEVEGRGHANILINFKDDVGGHTGDGSIKNGHGWWVMSSEIKKIGWKDYLMG